MSTENRAVSRPLYGQVREILLGRIGAGEWKPGDALPNEMVLASRFDVSVGTIRRAIEGLEQSGFLVRKQGRGTCVSGAGAHALQNRFTAIRMLNGRPLQLTYELLQVDRRALTFTESARLIEVAQEEVFHVVQRLRSTVSIVGRETSVIPVHVCPNLLSRLGTGVPLYSVLAESGVLVARTEDQIHVGAADEATSTSLGIERSAAVLSVKRLTYGIDPHPIEYRMATYLPSVVSHIAVT